MIRAILLMMAFILVVFWIVGFLVRHVFGPFIFIALVAAAILVIWSFVSWHRNP